MISYNSTFKQSISKLTLEMPITTAADNILSVLSFFLYFSDKIRLDISCELSAMQTIHIKCQVLFYQKKSACPLLKSCLAL